MVPLSEQGAAGGVQYPCKVSALAADANNATNDARTKDLRHNFMVRSPREWSSYCITVSQKASLQKAVTLSRHFSVINDPEI